MVRHQHPRIRIGNWRDIFVIQRQEIFVILRFVKQQPPTNRVVVNMVKTTRFQSFIFVNCSSHKSFNPNNLHQSFQSTSIYINLFNLYQSPSISLNLPQSPSISLNPSIFLNLPQSSSIPSISLNPLNPLNLFHPSKSTGILFSKAAV